MSIRMQQRRGLAQTWLDTDPVLAPGEIGIESDTGKFKFGNGIDLWSDLQYFSVSVDLSTYATQTDVSTAISNLIASAPGTLDTLNELAAAINDDASFASTMTTTLAGKAATVHTHIKSDITDFSHTHTKSNITDFAHTHTKSEITDFTHTHTKSEITDFAHTQNASTIVTTSTDKSANYTLVAGDKNSYIRSTGSAITITVPDVLADGESVNFIQAGAGQITFAGSGITLNSADAKLLTAKQFAGATVVKSGGAYYLIGNLA